MLVVVVNTFRRNKLLLEFLENHSGCEALDSIRVVWSDQLYSPPDIHTPGVVRLPEGHVPIIFHVHDTDSLKYAMGDESVFYVT